MVTEEDFWPIAEYPEPPGGYRYLCLLQLGFPKVGCWGFVSGAPTCTSGDAGIFCTQLAFICMALHFPGRVLQNISVKHSLASAEKLLFASRSHQWWIRYNGFEELLLQSIFSVFIMESLLHRDLQFEFAITFSLSVSILELWLHPEKKKKKEGNCFWLNCVEGDNFHTLPLSII